MDNIRNDKAYPPPTAIFTIGPTGFQILSPPASHGGALPYLSLPFIWLADGRQIKSPLQNRPTSARRQMNEHAFAVRA